MAEPITIHTLQRVRETSVALDKVNTQAKKAAGAMGRVADTSRKTAIDLTRVGKALKSTGEGLEDVKKSGDQASSVLDQMRVSTVRTRRGLDDVRTESRRARRDLKELAGEKAAILLEARDRLTPVLESAKSRLLGMTGKTWSVSVKLIDQVSAPGRGVSDILESIKNLVTGNGNGILGVITMSMDIAADYEESQADKSGMDRSQTVKGMLSTIEDTFENTFMLNLGTGLWEGFKPGLKKITDWLKDNQDDVGKWADNLKKLGSAVSGAIMGALDDAGGRIQKMIDSPEWEHADFFGKVRISWDRIIGDPFMEWWESSGKEIISQAAGEIGGFLGEGLKFGILSLLGEDTQELLKGGISAGNSFMDGFIKGFDPETVKKAVLDAISSIFSSSYFGGGSSILSTLLVGAVGLKGIGAGVNLGKGAYGAYTGAKGIVEGGAAAAGASLPVIGAAAGALLAGMGLESSVNDLGKAWNADHSWDRDRYVRQGITKAGLVASGAAAGAIAGGSIGSVVPVGGTIVGGLIGGGLGGLFALTGGNSMSDIFKSEREKTHESLLHMGDDLREAIHDFQETTSKTDLTRKLVGEYKNLSDTLNSPDFDNTKAEETQDRMKQILGELKETFPDLYTNYETLNGLSSERLDMIDKEMDKEDEQARRHLKQSVMDTQGKVPGMIKDYKEVYSTIEEKQDIWERTSRYKDGLDSLLVDYHSAMAGDLKNISQEDQKAALSNLLNGANSLAGQYGFKGGMSTYASVEGRAKDQGKNAKKLSDSIDKELEEKAALEEQLKTYYDSKEQLIEMENGVDLKENKEKTDSLEEIYNTLNSGGSLTEEMGLTAQKLLPGFSEAGDVNEQLDFLSQGIKALKDEAEPAMKRVQELNDTLRELPKDTQLTIGIQVKEQGTPNVKGNWGKVNKGFDIKVPINRPQPEPYAKGGLVASRELSWIGEDGLEAVIPLSGKYRKRGLELYEQAGHYLGVGNDGGGSDNTLGSADTVAFAAPAAVVGGATASNPSPGTIIQITASPSTQVQIGPGSTLEEIMSSLRQSWSGITDRMLSEIANKILLSYDNTPGGAT